MTARPSLPSPRSGGWVIVCGPSGAGKDSLLQWVASRLPATAGAALVLARRVITRPVHDSSPHAQCSDDAFDALLASDGFALHWAAHGVRYGVPAHYRQAIERGAWVVVNGSRAHARQLLAAGTAQGALRVVLVSAAPEVLARRLHQRGREDAHAVQARLARNAQADDAAVPADLVVVNDGALAVAGQQLLDYLLRLTAPALVTSRSNGSQ